MANGKHTYGSDGGGTVSITVPSGISTNTTVTLQDKNGTVSRLEDNGGRKNYLINGNFAKWDYGNTQNTVGYKSANMWFMDSRQGQIYTISKADISSYTNTDNINSKYFANLAFTPITYANDSVERGIMFDQWIEDCFLKMRGKTVTVSIVADTNQDFVIAFGNPDNTNSQGGNAPAWRKIESKKFTTVPGINKYTYTFTMPNNLLGTDEYRKHLLCYFVFGCNQYYADNSFGVGKISAFNITGTYFNLMSIKIEDGSVSTDGWHPYDGEFGSEVQACERYYEADEVKLWDGGTTNPATYIKFRTEKRSVPTIAFSNSTQGIIRYNTTEWATSKGFAASGTMQEVNFRYAASAEL